MKKRPFRLAALVLALGLCLSLPVLADGVEPSAEVDPQTAEEVTGTVDSVSDPETVVTLDDSTVSENGLVSALEPLFGPYTARTRTVTTTYADGTVTETREPIPGLAGLDWPWLAGVALFAVVLVCLFKLVGVVAKK